MKADEEKVDIAHMFWVDDWAKMEAYDVDAENVTWHVENCMTYLIQRSEEAESLYRPPPALELGEDWTEAELLMLYRDLLDPAVRRGYEPDPGVITRIKRVLAPKRIVVRRVVRP